MRSCMRLNAAATCRTSVAPSGLMGPRSRPMPNASAASARRRMARTWMRRNIAATANSSNAEPTTHSTNR